MMYVLVSEGLLVFAYLHGHSRALDTGREKVKGLDAMNGRGGKTSASLTEDKEREKRRRHASGNWNCVGGHVLFALVYCVCGAGRLDLKYSKKGGRDIRWTLLQEG